MTRAAYHLTRWVYKKCSPFNASHDNGNSYGTFDARSEGLHPDYDNVYFWHRLKNIAETVGSIPATNFLWQYLNALGIGKITAQSDAEDIFAIGSWKIAVSILLIVLGDHLIANYLKSRLAAT